MTGTKPIGNNGSANNSKNIRAIPGMFVRDVYFRYAKPENLLKLATTFKAHELGSTPNDGSNVTPQNMLIPLKPGVSIDLKIGENNFTIKYVQGQKNEKGEPKYGVNVDFIIQNKDNLSQFRGLIKGFAYEVASNNISENLPTEFIVRRDAKTVEDPVTKIEKVISDECSIACVKSSGIKATATMDQLVMDNKEYNETLAKNADKLEEIMKELEKMTKPERESALHGVYLYVKISPRAKILGRISHAEEKTFMKKQEEESDKGISENIYFVARFIVREKHLTLDAKDYQIEGASMFREQAFQVWKATVSLSGTRYNGKNPASFKTDTPRI
jgi:hypothetical protein